MSKYSEMFSGFRQFVGNAWNALSGFFSKAAAWFAGIVRGAKAERKEQAVSWTFPDYVALAQQLSDQPVAEVTAPGDKGRKIAAQIKNVGLVDRKFTSNQEQELESNVTNVASSLGYAFETGVVLFLVQQKGLELIGNWKPETLARRYEMFVSRVRDSYQVSGTSTRARDKFIELLQHNIGVMGEEIFSKSASMLGCEKLEQVEYIGLDQMSGSRSGTTAGIKSLGGADLIVTCNETGEMSYWSTKYMTNPKSSVAKKTPADVHKMLGGIGNRSNVYYDRLTMKVPEEAKPDVVLYDLWESLKSGYAVDKTKRQMPNKVILNAEWAANLVHSLVRGETGTNPAWMNYAAGRSAIGDYSPAFQRDFRIGRDNNLHSRDGAYAEASLEGAHRSFSTVPGAKRPRPAIKIKFVTPGQLGMRQTYVKIYVNPSSPEDDRYSNYNVQFQMNNLTTD